MSAIVFAIPGDIDAPTGGYGYDRRLLQEWRETGVTARHLALPGSFPFPTAEDLEKTECLLAETTPDDMLLIDGLAFGAFPEALATRFSQRLVALVHHPLALETGLAPDRAATLRASERAALRHSRAVAVTSPATARILAAEFDVPENRISVAVPGVDPSPRANGSTGDEPLQLLAVGSLIPRKGYDILIAALARIAALNWRLTIVGSSEYAPETAAAIGAAIRSAGLSERIALVGAVRPEKLGALYDKADLFVMPSLYEGYGMVLTEALARGLPIVCTLSGAGAEALPDTAALKIPPGDAAALAKALARLIDAPAERRQHADAAWAAAGALPRWQDTARIVARACLGDGSREVG
ncbi:Glycosyltransferase involved in cell wall biosynthesis [Hyphomicrobiales bacterium]|nr:Glycosyltransferase involved in cell wall biosynthesis [Hyphomicrobiales bacterium]CAH1699702.1 Glycosyltransferase involved in cell wall biosynthesis [Hyphomicrobiales bacterium]CAI0343433.1 Glycosyltransferase involved in cell wall biosynthesis [Hyphomicrobiales bacterium]